MTDNDYKRTIVIDPGDHIGIIYIGEHKDEPINIEGTTIEGDDRLRKLWSLLKVMKPETVVFERFALRANAAQKLVGSTFITCEVIGIIKLYCQINDIVPIELLPSCKEYCGFSSNPKDPHYLDITLAPQEKITEHVRDAYRLYKYYKLFGDKIK